MQEDTRTPFQKLHHPWRVSYTKAVTIQEDLRSRVIVRPLRRRVRRVAGCDVSYARGDDRLFAGVVVYDIDQGEVIEERTATGIATFPYIPGLLSFREAPILLRALRRISCPIDCLVFDGHGVAHPRGLGIASHVGVLLDRPSVGCAKKVLVGEHAPVDDHVGAFRSLKHGGRCVGSALRTRPGVKCVFTSAGHLVSQADARRIVLRTGGGYRLPEPTRLAHHLVTRIRLRE